MAYTTTPANPSKHEPDRPTLTAIHLLLAFVIPPLGLAKGLLRIYNDFKTYPRQLNTNTYMLVVLATIGFIFYLVLFATFRDNPKDVIVTPSVNATVDIVVCLDRKETITLTKTKGYSFGKGPSNASNELSLILANHLLAKENGDFSIIDGPGAGHHHIDRGACPPR